jgi:hypothetical protein
MNDEDDDSALARRYSAEALRILAESPTNQTPIRLTGRKRANRLKSGSFG